MNEFLAKNVHIRRKKSIFCIFVWRSWRECNSESETTETPPPPSLLLATHWSSRMCLFHTIKPQSIMNTGGTLLKGLRRIWQCLWLFRERKMWKVFNRAKTYYVDQSSHRIHTCIALLKCLTPTPVWMPVSLSVTSFSYLFFTSAESVMEHAFCVKTNPKRSMHEKCRTLECFTEIV